MNFIKNLFNWFIYGPQSEETPFSEPVQESRSDSDPSLENPSEEGLKNIFETYSRDLILKDLNNLAHASRNFEKAREELLKELQNIPSHRI